MTAACDQARAFIRRGYLPIEIPRGSKAPRKKKWTELRMAEDDVEGHFKGNENMGLLLGEPSGGLIDVDLDCSEAVHLAHLLLPETGWVFGRQSRPCSHRMYIADNGSCGQTKKFNAPDGHSIVEYRSTGAQTVVPPSVLKLKDGDGLERVEWQDHGNPAHVSDGAELQQLVAEIASAVMLVQHYPAQGARNELAKALSGTLDRMKWEVGRIERFIRVVATQAGDEEVENRVLIPRSTVERRKAGVRNSGSIILARIVSKEVVDWIYPWLSGVEQRYKDTKRTREQRELENKESLNKGFFRTREGRIIFDFAREIRGLTDCQGKTALDFLPEIKSLWQHRLSHKNWDDVLVEWMRVFSKVLTPRRPPLPAEAIQSATQVSLPPSCKDFPERAVLLAKLAVALQANVGQGSWFSLSSRQAQEHLGDDVHINAWNALQALCEMKFLKCVDRGVPGMNGRAAQYIVTGMGND